MAALEEAGFLHYQLRPALAVDKNEAELVNWAYHSGAKWPPFNIQHPLQLADQLFHFINRRRIALQRGVYKATIRQLQTQEGRTKIETAILLWAGGEMLLLATKTTN